MYRDFNTPDSFVRTDQKRRVRSLYNWLSKVTRLEACWIEGSYSKDTPIWAFVKRVTKNLFAVKSRKLALASLLIAPFLFTQSAIAQTGIDISNTLTGSPHGSVLNGIAIADRSGSNVASGDINGDGISDIIITATGANPNSNANAGETYIVFGSSSLNSSIELSSLNGTTGFVLNGESANDNSGSSVAVGDINGDNIDDVIIGARLADPPNGSGGTFNTGGRVYVVYGKTTAFSSSIDLSSLDGTSGFIFTPNSANEYTGRNVTSGDIDGDGFDDVIMAGGSAYYSSEKVSVLFGASNLASLVNASSLNGTTGFVLNRTDNYDAFGYENGLASGDIDGDGVEDLIIGANGAAPNGSNSGETYVVFGKTTGFSSSIDASGIIDGTNGFILNGVDSGDNSGFSVFAGDVNGDGTKDIIIGANKADPNNNSGAGETYVVFGSSSFASSIELSSLNGTNGFVLNGENTSDFSGGALSVSDINHDGTKDLIIGATGADPGGNDEGRTYVVFGSSNFASSIELSSLNGTNGFVLNGIDGDDGSGISLASGDVNGDGSVDLIIGADRADPNGNVSGETYVFMRPVLNQSITGDAGFRTLSAPANGTLYDELLADFWTQGATGADTDSGSDNLYTWDQGTQAWVGFTNLNTQSLSAGNGFLFFIFSDDNGPNVAGDAGFPKRLTTLNLNENSETIDFNNGNVNPVSNLANNEFFFAGNPYLFPIDWDELTKTNLSNTVYVYDDANSTFQSWNGTVGNVANGLISTFQGFFIQGSGGSGSLTIEPADTVSTSVSLLKQVGPTPKALKIHAEAGDYQADAWLSLQVDGEISRDDFDGLALAPLNATYLRLATTIDTSDELQINALPIDQAEELVFPLNLTGVLEEDVANLSFEGLENFEGWTIAVRDLEVEEEYLVEAGTVINLPIDKANAKNVHVPVLPTPLPVKAKASTARYQLVLQPGVSVSTDEGASNLPERIQLEQNYPNPFNPSTRIAFGVPRSGLVRLQVFDLLGRQVATLVDGQQAAGRYTITFDASSLSSGVYIYRLQTADAVLTRKLTLIK